MICEQLVLQLECWTQKNYPNQINIKFWLADYKITRNQYNLDDFNSVEHDTAEVASTVKLLPVTNDDELN